MKTVLTLLLAAVLTVKVASFVLRNKLFSIGALTTRHTQRIKITVPGFENFKDDNEKKEHQLYLLDCLTSDLHESSFENMEKTDMRARLIKNTNFADLCVEMESKGLPTSGDKIDMLIRLLNYEIEPLSAARFKTDGAVLRYVSEEDIASGYIQRVPESERAALVKNSLDFPDAADLVEFRRDGNNLHQGPPVLTDNFIRKEINIIHSGIKRLHGHPATDLTEKPISCYVVAPDRSVFVWLRNPPVVVLVPDHSGWDADNVRSVADHLSRSNKAIVLVPDVYRGQRASANSSVEEVQQWANQRVDPEQVWDDLLSTLLYVRETYPQQSLSLLGVGYGGGRALEMACDLYTIACWSEAQELRQIPGIEQEHWSAETVQNVVHIHSQYGMFRKTRAGPEMFKKKKQWINVDGEGEGEGEIVTKQTLARDAGKVAEGIVELIQEEKRKEEEAARRKAREEVYGVVPSRKERRSRKEEKRGSRGDDSEEQYEDEDDLDESEDDDEYSDEEDTDGKGEEDEDGPTFEFDVNKAGKSKQLTDEELAMGVDLGGEGMSLDLNDLTSGQGSLLGGQTGQNAAESFKFSDPNLLGSLTLKEFVTQLKSQVNCVFNHSMHLERRLQFDTEKPSHTARTLSALIPQSVCTVQACHFNSTKVATEMMAPTRFIFWYKDASPGTVSEDVERLYKGFLSRFDEILDYSLIMYEEGTSSSFSSPVTEIDRISHWKTLVDVGIWLDTFRSRTGEDFSVAAGAHKWDRRSTIVVHHPKDLQKMSHVLQNDEEVATWYSVNTAVERDVDRQMPDGIV